MFDLRPLQRSWLQPTLQLTDESAAAQSPLLKIPKRASPLLVSVGGDESNAFLAQSLDYLGAWQEAGLPGEYLPQPGRNHYEAIYGLADPKARSPGASWNSSAAAHERAGGRARPQCSS